MFLVNTQVFILIGMQLKTILQDLAGYSAVDLICYGVLASLATTVIRMVWVFPGAYLPRFLFKSIRARDPYPKLAIGGDRRLERHARRHLVGSGIVDHRCRAGARPGDLSRLLRHPRHASVFQGVTLGWLIEKLQVGADTEGPAEEKLARLEMSKGRSRISGTAATAQCVP